MSSVVSWLDTSPDEQRRVRELIALFSEAGTLDELGLGQVRDVFSDALFPGISTIQTRARYFLFVPWAFKVAAKPGRTGAILREHADLVQRTLAETLRNLPRQEGVIGARAGARVKRLPSTVYWNGLLTFGILRRDVAPDGLSLGHPDVDAADELVVREVGDWHPTLPPVCPGFPHDVEGGLDLSAVEAAWLRERILESVPGTLLAHLVAADRAPDPNSRFPWLDPVAAAAPDAVAQVLRHAHLLSLVMQGATRLYGVLVAEAYERAGFNAVTNPVERQREAYLAWVREAEDARRLLEAWDQGEFWSFVRSQSIRVAPLTEQFMRAWAAQVVSGAAVHALDGGGGARPLVIERERAVKRGQARLANSKLLGMWGGGVGGGLDFRWPTVKTIVTDIREGLSHA